MAALALGPPACLEPKMLIDGFAFITPVLPIMIVQVPTIAACAGAQVPANRPTASSAPLFRLLVPDIVGSAAAAPAFIGPGRR
ncbi:hypothetical protein [Mesorhizobium sp.]|uniref:hypothetical protein n=1 Tax=Mesorhizobium sp. TaxID=1871066 RepID=UPI0025D3BEC2|nr:hypothetical protein [Mesorhizobium sp.]